MYFNVLGALHQVSPCQTARPVHAGSLLLYPETSEKKNSRSINKAAVCATVLAVCLHAGRLALTRTQGTAHKPQCVIVSGT